MTSGGRLCARPSPVPALLALAILALANLAFTEGFFDVEIRNGRLHGAPIDILNHGSRLMILALGMALVVSTGGVDLSVGAVMAIAGALLAAPLPGISDAAGIRIGVALAAGLLLGLWNGALVAAFRLPPVVATLVLMVAGRGVAQLLTGGTNLDLASPALHFIGNGALAGLPVAFWAAAAVAALVGFALARTPLATLLAATGGAPEAARLAGVPVARARLFAFAASGVAAAAAGILAASTIATADAGNTGIGVELDAILAVVIGGGRLTGGAVSVAGTLIGALFLQALTTTLWLSDVSAAVAPLPKAAVLLAACVLGSDAVGDRLSRLRRRALP